MNVKIMLDERLAAAAELVPNDAVLLDVGTDHGYLPVQLLLDGKVQYAGASDVNEDPLSKAVRTAHKYGVNGSMSFYLSDGLGGITDLERYTSVSICGMGGELIARIVDDSQYLRENRIPLILQPMSSAEKLSEYLAQKGFAITDERIAYAAGKVYRVMLAVYDGVKRDLTATEHFLGKVNIDRGIKAANFRILLCKNILKFKRIVHGKEAGNTDCESDRTILSDLCSIAEAEGIEYDNI